MKRFSVKLVIALMLLALLAPAFASCGGVQLELHFIVDGEVYDSITTNGAEVIKLPPNPEKEGYVFRGWYWDYGVWQEPFTAESLVSTPLSSSMSVYARFLPLDGEETQTTEPGTTEPGTTEPPATEPPATEEPTTEPPATEPPTTEEPPTDDPIPPEPLDVTDIATIIASENGEFRASGVVIGVNAQSFLLGDNTGMMLVYLKADPGVKVGDKVTVDGTTSVYGGATQFGIGTTVTVEQSGVTVKHPEPAIPSIEELNAYATAPAVTVKYVKLTGQLMPSGNYYNLNLGAAVIGSLTYPNAELKAQLDSMAGQNVEVWGYVTGVTGNSQYLNLMTTEVKLVTSGEPEDPTPTEADIATILVSEDGLYTTSGVVIGVNAQSFLLADNTGSLLVYLKAEPDVKVGDRVTVTGSTVVYAKAKQFTTDTTVTVTGSMEVDLGEPYVPTAEELNSLMSEEQIFANYLQLTGTLVLSGDYYNFNIDGCALIGSLTYPDAALAETLRAMEGQTFTVICFSTGISGNGKYLNIMVEEIVPVEPEEPEEPEEPTPTEADIATILASENGLYTTSGVVLAVNAQSFILADSTGSLLVYLKALPNVKVGDTVTVTGSTTEYAIAKQFTTDTVVTVTGTTDVTLNNPYEPTAEEIDSLLSEEQIFVNYVKLTGTLTVSGNYYNFYMDGATLIGSLTYPMDDLKAELDALKGQTFTVIGFSTGISGNGKYLNIMVEEIVPVQPDEPELPEIIGEISIADAIAMGNAMEHNTTTFDLYYVRGTIAAIGNTTYGNMHITDKEGNLLYIYGLYNEDGSLSFGEMDPKPAIGDTILLLSVIGNYNGAQLKGAYLIEWTPAENNDPVDADIATIVDSDPGLFCTSGVVVCLNAKSMIIMDNSTGAMMLVYLDRQPEVAVGDMVELVGTTTSYGGCKQFGTDTEITVTGHDEVNFGDSYRITAEELDYFATADRVLVNYVTVEGLLDVTDNGYYNLYFDGAAIVGSLTYPDQALADELAVLNGQTITLIGFITNTASNGRFLSIMVHEIVYDEPEEPEEPTPTEADIATILASENGLYTTSGVVLAVNAQSFLLGDDTGMMLVYLKEAPGVQVGDRVTVEGTTSVYGGAKQFGIGTAVTVEESGITVKHPEPVTLSPTELDAYMTATEVDVLFVELTGLLAHSGNFYNFFFDGAAITGSLSYPDQALAAKLDSLVDSTCTVTGYITGTASNGIFLSIMVVDIQINEPELPDVPVDPEPEEPVVLTPQEILDLAYGLANGETTEQAYTLTGVISSIDTAWSDFYGNITVTIIVDGNTDQPIKCFRLEGDGAQNLQVGDTITVTGTLTNYNGIIEFAAGCILDSVVPVEPETPVDPEPEEPVVLTPQEILDLAYGLANGETTEQAYTLTGVISSIDTAWSDFYGNITVTIIVDGNTDQPIKCFRLEGDGAQNLQVGDTITVTGTLTNYNDIIEFAAGCILDSVVPVEPETPVDPEPEEPTPTETDIATILASENGLYTTSGTVVGVNAKSFLLTDGAGYILVYLNTAPGVTVGDMVEVSGTTTVYGCAKQFGTGTTVTVIGSADSVEHPEPVALSPSELDAYMNATEVDVLFVELTGLLSHSGNFYNFFFDGAAITGSLTYPDQALAATLDSLVDSTCTVTGYITGTASNGIFLSIMVVDIQINEPELPDVPVDPEPEEPTPADDVITNAGVEIKEGVAYMLSMNQVNNGHVVYVCGGIDQDRFLITSEDAAAALQIFVEKNGDGYNFYTTIDGAKKYINVTYNDAGKVAILYQDVATSVYTYVSETNIWMTVLDGQEKYIGSYSSFDTLSASNTSYINAENTGVSQFPVELVLY